MKYEPEFKKEIVRLHVAEGRSIKSLEAEYGVAHQSVSNWVKQYREESQNNADTQKDYDATKELANLKKELAEVKKENDFLIQWGPPHFVRSSPLS